MQIKSAIGLHCATARAKGSRPGVMEQHSHYLQAAMAHLRGLGHAVNNVIHSTKSPTGYAKSTILHKSGKNKFKTHVRTKFNSEGGDHDNLITTEPDTDQQDASSNDSSEE